MSDVAVESISEVRDFSPEIVQDDDGSGWGDEQEPQQIGYVSDEAREATVPVLLFDKVTIQIQY